MSLQPAAAPTDVRTAGQAADTPSPQGRHGMLAESAMLLGLLAVYFAARGVADGQAASAFDHTMTVLRWQRTAGLPSERPVQQWLLEHLWLTRAANSYYATVHFPLTAATLVWLYLCRPNTYPWTRNVLVTMTAAALVLALTFPLAPPRMIPDLGFADPATALGQSVYGPPGTGLANQFAAMPSLHVGWALLVALALITSSRTRWRWLWLAHPVATVLTVVGTGNHYWADGLVAAALLLLALPTQSALTRVLRCAPHETPRPAGYLPRTAIVPDATSGPGRDRSEDLPP